MRYSFKTFLKLRLGIHAASGHILGTCWCMKMKAKEHPTDCGLTYRHDSHVYLTSRGIVKACDGSTTKRNTQTVEGNNGSKR